ncbi:MAG TPA: S8 family serine peptidase [Chloroflexota bacterium]|nr:S8 family serine peptidase [Chloroflexota bacterium]
MSVALGAGRLAAADQESDLRDAAVRLIAARAGLPPARLAVVTTAVAGYPALGVVGQSVKVLDIASGTVYTLTLDRAGQALDSGQLVQRERAAQQAQGLVREPLLAARAADALPDELLPVVFWLREPPWARPVRPPPTRAGGPSPSRDQARTLDAAVVAARAAVVRPLLAPLLSRLRAAGAPAMTAGSAPAVYASVPARLLAELSSGPEIDRVYLAGVARPDLDVARPTIRADIVQARGLTGQGVQIAQIEPNGHVSAANPFLAGVLQDLTYVCAAESDHATAVAGVLRSTHPGLRGIAPDSSLRVGGSCSGVSGELADRASAAADWGARVFSLSYSNDLLGRPGPDDRFYDDLAFNRHIVVVKSAGNGGLSTRYVTSPGMGYNVLTVGNFDDRNTAAWGDDAMNPTSSYVGPISAHGDRRKPELAAPGTNVHTLSLAAPWDTYTSTGASFATPMVAGAAALLLQRNPDLAQWPEAVRAILMTTAVNPLAGDPSLAGHGGVGGLVADRADDVAQRANGDWGAQAYGCDAASPLDVATIALPAAQRVRAALAWNTDPSWQGWPSQPGADLDLAAVGPAGDTVALSASLDNSYEVVEFVTTAAGEYRLRVSLGRCDSSPNGVAWAWHNVSVQPPTATPTTTPTRPPATATATPIPPPTVTPSPTPLPACGPTRPPVTVSVARNGGRLVVTVAAQTLPGGSVNTISSLRFGPLTNALVEIGGTSGRSGSFDVVVSPPSAQTSFVVRQASPGQAATVPFTVFDSCGAWPTFVGGGPSAFAN